MRENNIELQNRFEMQIDNSNLSADNKEYMKRIVDGIMKSPKGRLYLINDPQFQKYITFRKDMSMPNPALDYCVVSVMKNPDTGFTEGRDYNFPGLKGFCELARENERVLASELVNSQNYQRVQSGAPRVEKEQPSEDPKQKCKRLVKESIEKLANVPDYKKQRVYDVLDMIDKAGKIKAVDQGDYVEHLTMKNDKGIYGYYIVQKTMDYSGATMDRRYVPLGTKSLVAYVEENREEIDKQVKKAQNLGAR